MLTEHLLQTTCPQFPSRTSCDATKRKDHYLLTVFLLCLSKTQNYLDNFWPDLKAAHELCDSILQSRRERENESQESHGKEYAEHLPLEVLEAGIKSGRYIQVRVVMGLRRWHQLPCFLLCFTGLLQAFNFKGRK